jgi:(p)ppGpp synthase/HD superfamily hydrolase
MIKDLIEIISNQMHLSIDNIHAVTEDYIGNIQIKMRVPSAFELSEVIRAIENVEGVEEVRTL